jgi:SprB repeat/Secretion system C-terminal sorting domain
MKKFLVVVLLVFCCFQSFSQGKKFQLFFRLDRLESTAFDNNGSDTRHSWALRFKEPLASSFTDCEKNEFGERDGDGKVYPNRIILPNKLYDINDFATASMSVLAAGFEDEDNDFGNCWPQGNDRQQCETGEKVYFFKNYAPSKNHTIIETCGKFTFVYTLRWDILPPSGQIQVRDNPVAAPFSNHCVEKDIFVTLASNSNDQTLKTEYEYYWEYHFVGDNDEVVNCNTEFLGGGRDCGRIQQAPSSQSVALALATCEDGTPYDPDCERCVCTTTYTEKWYYLATTPIDQPAFNFKAFQNGGLNNMKLRVKIRKKANTSYASATNGSSNPTNFFIFTDPPNMAPTPLIEIPINTVAEAIHDGLDIKLEHVKCKGDKTGKIIIKGASLGRSKLYFNLRKDDGTIVMNINGADFSDVINTRFGPTVVPRYPLVFPDNANNSNGLAGLPAGKYELRMENTDNPELSTLIYGDKVRMCFDSYTFHIREPAEKVSASFNALAKGNGNPHAISCNGLADASVQITPTGGVGTYDFSLQGFTAQNDQSGVVTFAGLGVGNYPLIVTDELGCTHTLNVSGLTAPEPITIVQPTPELFDGFAIKCKSNSASVDVFVNAEDALPRIVTINNVQKGVPNDGTAATYTLPAATYEVTGSYTFGCAAAPVQFTLNEPEPLKATFVASKHPSCLTGKGPADNDGYLELKAEGGIAKAVDPYTMYLTASPTTILNGATVRFTNLKQGNYQVVVQDKYCTSTINSADFVVPINPTPIRFASDAVVTDPTCFGYANGKITVEAADGIPFNTNKYRYYIDNTLRSGEHTSTEFTSAIGFPISQKSYELKIEDSKKCFDTRTVVVSQPAAITALTTVTDNICFGDAGATIKADLFGGTSPYTVQWKDPTLALIKPSETVVASNAVNNLKGGTYTVEIKDARGCTNKQEAQHGGWFAVSKEVIDPPILVPTVFLSEDASCFNATDGYVSVSATGGVSTSYRYSIDNTNFKIANDFSGLRAGSYTLYVRDGRGCVRSTPHTVKEPGVLLASITKIDDAQCFGFSNGSAQLQLSGGTTPYYVRKNATDAWLQSNMVSNLQAETHTLLVRDENNCASSIQAVVGQPSKLNLDKLRVLSSTCGSANGEAEVLATGGIVPYNYKWFDSNNTLVKQNALAGNMLAGNYRVEVTDKNLCSTPLSVAISDIGGAKITQAVIKDATCSYTTDGAIDVSIAEGTQPYDISWTNGAKTEDLSALAPGQYQVTVTDANNCKVFKTVQVSSPLPLAVDLLSRQLPNCYGDSNGMIQVSFVGGNGGYIHQWANGNVGTKLENIAAGDYAITVTDIKGCVLSTSVNLENPPKFEINIDDKTICVGQVHTINGGIEGATYQWTSANGFSSSETLVTLTEAGAYQVKVVSENGCEAIDGFTITTSTDLLKAEFLMARNAVAGDTVVVIDISWPLPEAITWKFDPGTSKIIHAGQDYAEIIFDNPGVYEISLDASLGDCQDVDVQFVTVDEDTERSNAKITSDSDIQKFQVYPNPSNGNFSITVELKDNAPVARLRMINLSGNKTLFTKQYDQRIFVVGESMTQIPRGVYFILLEVGKEKKLKRIVIH